jgi:hypothetical protein
VAKGVSVSNQRRFQRRQYRSNEGRRAPSYYSAAQLHRYLVEDAVKGHATDLKWSVAAYQEIASKRGITIERATRAVFDEVEAAGRTMPML